MQIAIFLALFLTFSPLLLAQSEADLRDYFEGRQVVTKIEMPGDKSGIDIRVEEDRPLDFAELGRRLKRYGIALREGDRATVTLVKVNKRNIEFQVAGGGFGTLGDSTTSAYINTYVSKSDREKRLEAEIKRETDLRRKKRLQEELDEVRRDREREQARLEAEAAQAQIMAEGRERELRATSGSRFNLWFARSVPAEALTPQAVMAALSPYLEFQDQSGGRFGSDRDFETGSRFVLRKGVTESDLTRAYGEPVKRQVEHLAELTVSRAVYDTDDGEIAAVFVEGILVRYSFTSR
jgi:multidrug efflux pump subunit AcrA (membrane-fusion protein)